MKSDSSTRLHPEKLRPQNAAAKWQSALFFLLLLWIFLPDAYRGAVSAAGLHGLDFRVIYEAARRLNAGETLYQQATLENGAYLYSPLVAIFCRPFATLSFDNALKIWTLLNIGFLVGSVALYASAARFKARDTVAVAIALFVAFRFWPTTTNFGLGQFNIILLPLLGCLGVLETRRFKAIEYSKIEQSQWRHDLICGLILALLILVKTWMIGFLLYPLLERRWRQLFACALFCAVLTALSFSLVGWHEWANFLRNTRENVAQPWLVSHSFPGFARLQLLQNPLNLHPVSTNLALYRAFLGMSFALCAAALWKLWRFGPARNALESRLKLAFCLAFLLLILPLCHMEYFVLCLPLLWILLASPHENSAKMTASAFVAAALIYVVLTRPWPSASIENSADFAGARSLLLSMPFFANCALCVTGFFALKKVRAVNHDAQNVEPI